MTSIVNGERHQETWLTGSWNIAERIDSDEDSDNNSQPLTSESEEAILATECGELILVIEEGIKSLLSLSFLIQKSSRRSKFE